MATRKVGARVELDGEREYKQALQEINTGNATLRTEMQKLQAEYKGNADSAEYLTKKSELLERQLLQQQDKVAKLREAVKASADQYGEADTRTQKWIQQLNQAEAAEFELRNQLDETSSSMEDQGEEMVGLGDTVTDLADKFGVRLPKGVTSALNSMSSFSAGTVAAMGVAAAAIAGVAEAVKALHENAIEYAAQADELMTQSMVTGLSTTLLQELQYAEPMIDVSVETITGSMKKLTTEMADAAGGNEKLQESFKNLGVSITGTDGQLRSAEDVFFDIVDALGEMGNDTERDAVAMALLGKSAQELNPLIKQGTDTLRDYMKAADENYVLTEDQIAALGELDDAVHQNELQWEALKKQLAAQFAPTSTKVLETFGEMVEMAGNALIDSGIIQGVGEVLEMLINMFSPLTQLLDTSDKAPDRLRPVYTILHSIAGVLAWIADAANVAIGLVQTLTIVGAKEGLTRIGTALGYGASSGNYSNLQKWQGMGDMTGNYYDKTTGLYTGNYGRNAGGSDNWRGGLTWVGESGPELVALPGGSQILSAQDSRNLGGGDTFYISIDAQSVKEFNDIVELAQSARVRSRMR